MPDMKGALRLMRVGIDIGGTFTDIITISDEGVTKNYKIPSTPLDPSQAVLQALKLLSNVQGAEVNHGSTVATNTILERKGAKTALLTTEGFRDIIYIQRQDKKDVYTLTYRKPVPVVSRDLIVEVKERILHTGEILVPLDVTGLEESLEELVNRNGIQSIAVCFLHSYKNPKHEKEVAALLGRLFPNMAVTISSEILPEVREYERASTTLLSAYLKPVVANYINRIEERLQPVGARFLVMQSNGGILLSKGTKHHPGQMFLSGPAAGVTGAIHVGSQCGFRNLFTLDVGGTSTDTTLITEGTASVTTEMCIDGLPIAFPMIDIVSVGAGGGSIAWIDDGGMLRVGPKSAGAEPGPACYGKGGQEFTVTDAFVIMGLIRPDRFLGGKMKLDLEASLRAARPLAEKFRLTAEELAKSVFQINMSNVTQAMRLVSIERGFDPKDYTLFAFGGGGPLHAALVAEELGINAVIVPPYPGLFSAYGLLVADFRRDFVVTEPMEIHKASPERIGRVLFQLQLEAERELVETGITLEGIHTEYTIDIRYTGQGHELNVPVTKDDIRAPDLTNLRRVFDRIHLEKYGHNFPEDDVELVSFRAHVYKFREKPELRVDEVRYGRTDWESEEYVYWKGQRKRFCFLERYALNHESHIEGPAVIVEDTSTTLLPPDWSLEVDSFGNLRLRREPQ